MMKPLLDIDQVYNIILQEEKQRALTTLSQFNNDTTAFNASNHDMAEHTVLAAQQRSYNLGFPSRPYNASHISGHNLSSSGNNTNFPLNQTHRSYSRPVTQDRRPQMFCDHCKMSGHTI